MGWLLVSLTVPFLVAAMVLFSILLHCKYKQSIGIEARRQALREAVEILEEQATAMLELAPKNRMFSVLSTKVMVLTHAKEKIQYLLDKTK